MNNREASGDGQPGDEELASAVAAAMRAAGFDDPQAIYLFGSAAHGRLHRESDIDLAVLVKHPADPVRFFDVAQRLAGELGTDVDLLDLARTSTVMRVQVLGGGRRISCSDHHATDCFEMYALSDYARLQEERAGVLLAFTDSYRD